MPKIGFYRNCELGVEWAAEAETRSMLQ